MEILTRYAKAGLSPSRVVENALTLGELCLGMSTITLSDLNGTLHGVKSALREHTLCKLETFKLLTELELLIEHQQMVEPLEQDLAEYNAKPKSKKQ